MFHTKRGDDGTTVIDSKKTRVNKNHGYVIMIGKLDNLQAELGIMANVYYRNQGFFGNVYLGHILQLENIINHIYDYMSILYTTKIFLHSAELDSILIERKGFTTNKFLKPQPANEIDVNLHRLRTIVRETEISVVSVNCEDLHIITGIDLDFINDMFDELKRYLNRLSAIIFTYIIENSTD